MMQKIMKFIKDEDGIELVEYAIMAGLVIIVAVGAVIAIGQNVDRVFGLIDAKLDQVVDTPST